MSLCLKYSIPGGCVHHGAAVDVDRSNPDAHLPFMACLSESVRHRFWSQCKGSFCAATVQQSSLLWGDRGVTNVVSHCYIDRYSNYNLLHSVPISIQHQQALKVSLYACQIEQKLNIQWLWHSKRHTDPFWGLDIKLCHGFMGWRIWYDF